MMGFRGQSMSGRNFSGVDLQPIKLTIQPNNASEGGTFVAPKTGLFLFALHGVGGGGSGAGLPGGPGGLAIRVVNLLAGQAIPWLVGGYASGAASTVTFADGVMRVTAGAASVASPGGVGGVATGGDVNINGTAGATQAASYGDITGGIGTFGLSGLSAGAPGIGDTGPNGGAGRLLVIFLGVNQNTAGIP